MKYKIILLIILLAAFGASHAQEVFFDNPNTKLKTITPDYYYPLQYDIQPLRDYMNPVGSRDLTFDDNGSSIQPVTDRWFAPNKAVTTRTNVTPSQSYGGLKIPGTLKNEILNNKVLNMSFWIKPDGDVTDPSLKRRGSVFYIANGNGNLTPKVSVEIEDLRIKVKILKGGNLVPIITADFPINWETIRAGDETNGFFFFCITSTWNNDGNRCRIYVGRPGGSLYCKYFYCSPFTNDRFTGNDELFVCKPMRTTSIEPVASRPLGISDLMFYTTTHFASYMMSPDEVLNNFYLQSPLYEGVSYEITAGLHTENWGLESRNNYNVDLAEEYVTVENTNPGASNTPFGFNRFYIENIPGQQGAFKIRNMANGARLVRYSNNYMYTRFNGPEFTTLKYLRNVPYPDYNYKVEPGVHQFHFIDFYNPNMHLARAYQDGRGWLFYRQGDGSSWRITAAAKVFRGPQRMLYGEQVQLKNYGHGLNTGSPVKHNDPSNWDFVGLNRQISEFSIGVVVPSAAYVKNFFITRLGKTLSAYNGNGDLTERNRLITGNFPTFQWELVYVKDDPNNKPLYMLRTSNDNVAFKAGVAFGDYDASQQYKNALEPDGSVADRRLWNVCKVSGGYSLTDQERVKLSQDILKSQQNLNKVYFNELSRTDWPDGAPKP